MNQILILNGSIHGRRGNCQILIKQALKFLKGKVAVDVIHLAEVLDFSEVKKKMAAAHGYVFVSGTYWDSWGSPLQKFLEEITDLEGAKAVVGKPCAVMILEHSVGGKGVLSRLQGVLSTFGLLIPPMSGMVYSSLIHASQKTTGSEDYWSLEDLEIVLGNLLHGMEQTVEWKVWPVDRKNFRRKWLRPD